MDDFTLATKYIATAPYTFNSSNDMKLTFYKYYKQATAGNCMDPQPNVFNFVNHAKWKAWMSVKGMSQENAKILYIQEIEKFKKDWKQDAIRLNMHAL